MELLGVREAMVVLLEALLEALEVLEVPEVLEAPGALLEVPEVLAAPPREALLGVRELALPLGAKELHCRWGSLEH